MRLIKNMIFFNLVIVNLNQRKTGRCRISWIYCQISSLLNILIYYDFLCKCSCNLGLLLGNNLLVIGKIALLLRLKYCYEILLLLLVLVKFGLVCHKVINCKILHFLLFFIRFLVSLDKLFIASFKNTFLGFI